ncbi:MAG: hypothetical protein WDA11_12860 [Thiohalomonadaceae bacterium]
MVTKQQFFITPIPPFRLDLTVWALRRRAHNQVDVWDGSSYHRAILLHGGRVADVQVVQATPPSAGHLKVGVSGVRLDAGIKRELRQILVRMLGTDIDLRPFYALTAGDRRMAPLVACFRGLKPPRFPSLFEALVNGIACQQLSLTVGITLLNRLSERFGVRGSAGGHAFPAPAQLAGRDPAELRALGFSGQKVRALLGLAEAVRDGSVDMPSFETSANTDAVRRLSMLRGVGRWTAEYVLLRGLGRLDVFPGDDVGARKRLAEWLKAAEPLDYAAVGKALRRWHPYAGLLYFHLLLKGLADTGELDAEFA